MAKFKPGDRVVHVAHQEGPPGTGTVHEVTEKGEYKIRFDTGVRQPNGRNLEKVAMSTFTEDQLQAM